MGFFSKKNDNNEQYNELNTLMNLALEMNRETGSWHVLPGDANEVSINEVITARKMIFEYMRQLKEAGFYSNGAVKKFALEQHPWINKNNINKCISLSQFL